MNLSRNAIIGILVIAGGVGIALFSSRKQLSPNPPASPVITTTDEVKVTEAPVAATPAPNLILPKGAMKLSPKDQRKLVILQQILESKNDNDPRMDHDLANLSPEAKRAMEEYYKEIKPEQRNDRGTIVFLISREINSKADLDFLQTVLMEKPCQSLSDCSKTDAPSSGEAAHLEGINETTANYPQLMALKQMTEQYRILKGTQNTDPALASGILETFRQATRSPNPKVQQDAELALNYLTGGK
jgi:hypothetical protein